MHQHAPTSSILEVKNLGVALEGRTILENINFSVTASHTTAIIGPNGAGKSILLKTILRLIPKSTGEIYLFGVPHHQYRRVAPRISYIPQNLTTSEHFPLTVRDLFSLKSARRWGLSGVDKAKMKSLLAKVGMSQTLHQPFATLSGGQRQRIMLAYSLMNNPELLFLDEPSAGIDIQGQETIYSLLRKIQQEMGLTIILVSHELDVVLSYADQVLCLNKKLLCAGVPHEVLSKELLQEMYHMPVGHFTHQH